MRDKIILYNHFHNGDIFFSRAIINVLTNYFDIDYYHNLPKPLLSDIDNLNEINGIPSDFPIHYSLPSQKIINTWIGQENMVFLNQVNQGCSFENYIVLCNKLLNSYGIRINDYDYESILPNINFEKLTNITELKKTINEFLKIFKKIVLISNGNVNSAQALNFDFTEMLKNISQENPDILFITTQKTLLTDEKNIIDSFSITKKMPDLLDISFISTKCDIIIGRASGPFCFSQNRENLLNPDKKFISFNHRYYEGKYFDSQKSKFIWTNDYSYENIINTIKNNL